MVSWTIDSMSTLHYWDILFCVLASSLLNVINCFYQLLFRMSEGAVPCVVSAFLLGRFSGYNNFLNRQQFKIIIYLQTITKFCIGKIVYNLNNIQILRERTHVWTAKIGCIVCWEEKNKLVIKFTFPSYTQVFPLFPHPRLFRQLSCCPKAHPLPSHFLYLPL